MQRVPGEGEDQQHYRMRGFHVRTLWLGGSSHQLPPSVPSLWLRVAEDRHGAEAEDSGVEGMQKISHNLWAKKLLLWLSVSPTT